MSQIRAHANALLVCILLAAACLCGAAQDSATPRPAPESTGYTGSRPPLAKAPFLQLSIGSIKPKGWLRKHLELAATGLTGHLDELDPENLGRNSGWLGGSGESWERGPYYVRGLTALAYVLQEPLLIEKARKWLEWSIESQDEDGYFGPQRMKAGYDWWPNMVMLQALEEYHEATGDPRVLRLMSRYFAYQLKHIKAHSLTSWAKARGADNLASVLWLYDRTGEQPLLELGAILRGQTAIWDIAFLNDLVPTDHGVNVAQGLKAPIEFYRLTRDPVLIDAYDRGFDRLMREHGQIEGLHSGDEALAGRDPIRGTELCTVVEFLHSQETILKILGDPRCGDRIEKVAYNALPAMLTADMRGHQYFLQPNQVQCTLGSHGFQVDHLNDLVFAPLTSFPCCRTNHNMGWPKLACHLWLATDDGGLAAAIYAPCEVNAKIRDGGEALFLEETDYPFGEGVTITCKSPRPAVFPVRFRIPAWCESPQVTVNGQAQPRPEAGKFFEILRKWSPGDTIRLEFPMTIRLQDGIKGSVGVERGPLVFALRVNESWARFGGTDEFPAYELLPASAWNYALVVDRQNPQGSFRIERVPMPENPWWPETTPIRLQARGRRLIGWVIDRNNAGPLPESPVGIPPPDPRYGSSRSKPEEDIVLIPFGAARMRISVFPWAEP